MKYFAFIYLITGLIAISACTGESETVDSGQNSFDWRSDWAVKEGFSLSIDTEGYNFPTAIAFVPNPGNNPEDPLYFVTELRGTVKVVTNDRTVHTFAEDFFQLEPAEELPSTQGEMGLAGICLEPKEGYVFVTFAYQESNRVLRNNVVRFHSEPEVFSLKPTAQTTFTEIFSAYESAQSHQIGHCQVKDDLFYVSVGDGRDTPQSQSLDSLLGKVVRMTLDGEPVPTNPFFQDNDVTKANNYVWAYGLRNPFGLKAIEDQIFVADNGPSVDRFLLINEGENYLWDGSDWSMGSKADVTLTPSIGPAQVDYYSQDLSLFPTDYNQDFFVASSGNLPWTTEPAEQQIPGIVTIEYEIEENKIRSVPEYFLRYRGNDIQMVVGLGFGPDGLYVVPLYPNQEGKTFVFKVTHDPNAEHPYTIAQNKDPLLLMNEKGCFGCHSLNDVGGVVGPALDREEMVSRLQVRLNSKEYLQMLEEVDRLEDEPFTTFKEARREVVEAEGEDKIRVWMKYRLLEPRFDTPTSQMPNTGLSEKEALSITNYLLAPEEEEGLLDSIKQLLPPRRFRYLHLAESFVVGFVFAGVLWGLSRFFVKKGSQSQ